MNKTHNEKIEICYLCGKEFDMNASDKTYYRYGKYPICDYCSDFYGFYKKEL
ncbi:MAG: hypothetical protein LBU40_04555 [Methanobrevibacter sp.]|jgi:ssDNA-binding Zn-finger/Zn-ribbon topoisomerase 1|nr:hypothetical protein [Methanobrevibacter sp.]